jgi:hypothetical protein
LTARLRSKSKADQKQIKSRSKNSDDTSGL